MDLAGEREPAMPRRRPILGPFALAGLCACLGCTHNHYYYGPGGLATSGTGPVVVGSTPTVVASKPRRANAAVVAGSYCDVPPVAAGDPVIVSSTPRRGASPVVTRPGAPTPAVVASDPVVVGQDGWRRRSPESMATTRVTGSLDDELAR
jgi:hypothetical protein